MVIGLTITGAYRVIVTGLTAAVMAAFRVRYPVPPDPGSPINAGHTLTVKDVFEPL
jgi:hypothetical protein